VDPVEIVATGEFDLESLIRHRRPGERARWGEAVVLDTMDIMFGTFGDDSIVRSESGGRGP
jgi:hypothetical protein